MIIMYLLPLLRLVWPKWQHKLASSSGLQPFQANFILRFAARVPLVRPRTKTQLLQPPSTVRHRNHAHASLALP